MSAKQREMERQTYMMMNRVNNNSMRQQAKVVRVQKNTAVIESNNDASISAAAFFVGMAGLFCLTDLMFGLINIIF